MTTRRRPACRRWPRARGALRVAVAAVALALAACHHAGAPDRGAPAATDEQLTIRVVNHNWLDVTIYLVHGGRQDRLGLATATSTTTFTLRLRNLSGGREYRLRGDPVGSRQTVTTEALRASGGDLVTWSLETDLSRSSVTVH